MRKQAIVIGLGQFGMALARSLAERGVELIAVDLREDRVKTATEFAASAVSFDATDEAALRKTAPERRELAICAIGDEAREASIICTALLRQLGATRVVARATDPLHERILWLVGAHEVVNPERAFGERFATRLLHEGVIDEVPLGHDLVLTELKPPAAIVGRSLIELQLPRKHELTVVAIRDGGKEVNAAPNPAEPIGDTDILVVIAPPGAVGRFLERVGS
jgi:trk system potassium uptake protein TrkA